MSNYCFNHAATPLLPLPRQLTEQLENKAAFPFSHSVFRTARLLKKTPHIMHTHMKHSCSASQQVVSPWAQQFSCNTSLLL